MLSGQGLACHVGDILGQYFIMRLSQAELEKKIGKARCLPNIEEWLPHFFLFLHVHLPMMPSSFQID